MVEDESRVQRETLAVAALLFLGSLFILYPFLDAIIMALATAYLLRFAHDRINSRIHNDLVSSIIIISAVLGVVSLGTFFFINNFFDILSQLNQFTGSLRDTLLQIFEMLNLPETFQQNVDRFINRISEATTSTLLGIFTSLPSVFIDLGIFLVTAVYLYRDRSKIENQLHGLLDNLPAPEAKILRSLIRSIDNIFRGVFMTQVIVALILGVLTAVGFSAIAVLTSSIPFIPLWAFLVGVAALLPLMAAFMVYGPLGIYYLFVGQPLKGVIILVFGAFLLNVLSEIFIRPYIGSRQMDEHPLVVFLGFLAGPLVLGLKGLIIGPLLLILTKEFILNYTNLVSGYSVPTRSEDTAEN
ncbi:MAG: AI-2E family transporter [Candidatus Nanohaloarchaea archaeon]